MNTDFEKMNTTNWKKLSLEAERKKKKREYNRRYYKKHIHGKPRTKEVESDIILGKVDV